MFVQNLFANSVFLFPLCKLALPRSFHSPNPSVESLHSSSKGGLIPITTSSFDPSFLLTPGDDLSRTTITGCEVTVPWETLYDWVSQGSTSNNVPIPTNEDGTRLETIEITTGGFHRDGEWIHQTTHVVMYVYPNYTMTELI